MIRTIRTGVSIDSISYVVRVMCFYIYSFSFFTYMENLFFFVIDAIMPDLNLIKKIV